MCAGKTKTIKHGGEPVMLRACFSFKGTIERRRSWPVRYHGSWTELWSEQEGFNRHKINRFHDSVSWAEGRIREDCCAPIIPHDITVLHLCAESVCSLPMNLQGREATLGKTLWMLSQCFLGYFRTIFLSEFTGVNWRYVTNDEASERTKLAFWGRSNYRSQLIFG